MRRKSARESYHPRHGLYLYTEPPTAPDYRLCLLAVSLAVVAALTWLVVLEPYWIAHACGLLAAAC